MSENVKSAEREFIQAIKWDGEKVSLIDQLRLPTEERVRPLLDERLLPPNVERLLPPNVERLRPPNDERLRPPNEERLRPPKDDRPPPPPERPMLDRPPPDREMPLRPPRWAETSSGRSMRKAARTRGTSEMERVTMAELRYTEQGRQRARPTHHGTVDGTARTAARIIRSKSVALLGRGITEKRGYGRVSRPLRTSLFSRFRLTIDPSGA